MKAGDKIKIEIVDKTGRKMNILIPKNSDYTLVTEYISRSIEAFNRTIEDPIETDPGDEQQYVHNG